MTGRSRWRIAAGAAALLAVAAALVAMLSPMNHPSAEDTYLIDSQDMRFGWRYEVLADGAVREYEPRFAEDGYMMLLPEGVRAVRITRTMTEDVPDAELEWFCYQRGVEVFLDGELLHSDFSRAPRDANGFASPEAADWERIGREQSARRIRMTLPDDYLGRELSVITYFPAGYDSPEPVYPHLSSDLASVAGYVVACLKSNIVMTVYGLLALLIAGMYMVDAHNGGGDGRSLLLCLYFLLLFAFAATNSFFGYCSQLVLWPEWIRDLLYRLYVAPLYLYLALRLKGSCKWPLCAAVAGWILYEIIVTVIRTRSGMTAYADIVGPLGLAVFLAVITALIVQDLRQDQQDKRARRGFVAAGCAVLLLYLIGRGNAWDSLGDYLRDGIWGAIVSGNFGPLVDLTTEVTSGIVLIVTITEFVRRTLRSRQEMSVLQDRTRQTMEGYERLLAAEDATNALHHEMRHHMTALSAILGEGDVGRASRYVEAVMGDLKQLPVGRYSQNMLVNVIAGSYLDRARAQWIRVESQLNVPPELNIEDEDLSVFLSNMLQNALEACERIEQGQDRYIKVDMHLRGNFLFIRCVNSAPNGPDTRGRRPRHGYGIAAMRSVAEKYNSVLVAERSPGEYAVMSDLCLPER